MQAHCETCSRLTVLGFHGTSRVRFRFTTRLCHISQHADIYIKCMTIGWKRCFSLKKKKKVFFSHTHIVPFQNTLIDYRRIHFGGSVHLRYRDKNICLCFYEERTSYTSGTEAKTERKICVFKRKCISVYKENFSFLG